MELVPLSEEDHSRREAERYRRAMLGEAIAWLVVKAVVKTAAEVMVELER